MHAGRDPERPSTFLGDVERLGCTGIISAFSTSSAAVPLRLGGGHLTIRNKAAIAAVSAQALHVTFT